VAASGKEAGDEDEHDRKRGEMEGNHLTSILQSCSSFSRSLMMAGKEGWKDEDERTNTIG